jgi:polyhydroxybutyrate depolymerase
VQMPPRRIAIVIIAILSIGELAMVAVGGRLLNLRSSLRFAASLDEKRSIWAGGVTRNYLLHVPADLPAGKSAPLVLVFHGGGGHDWNMPGFTHFDDLADQKGFYVAYPDAVNRHWNDSRGESDADDIGFTRALIAELERTHSIDAHRIYAAGISNGGFFSNRLACDLGDKIAAIASVAATMPHPLVAEYKPARPISVLYMLGTEDPLVPINGGTVGLMKSRGHGENISLADSAKFWRAIDGVAAAPEVKDFSDRVGDGTHVHREIFTGGKENTEIDVYTIEGGGHTWPGGIQYLPKVIVGKASQNLNATRTVWEFFQNQQLP